MSENNEFIPEDAFEDIPESTPESVPEGTYEATPENTQIELAPEVALETNATATVPQSTNADANTATPHRRHYQISAIAVRVAYVVVFIVNVQCAISFLIWPETNAAAYELSDISGAIAIQGFGIVFLMWNATYPAYIISPHRFRSLGIVILVQQIIGLVGELWLLSILPEGHSVLAAGLERFAIFDGFGLAIMAATFIWFSIVEFAYFIRNRKPKEDAATEEPKGRKRSRKKASKSQDA